MPQTGCFLSNHGLNLRQRTLLPTYAGFIGNSALAPSVRPLQPAGGTAQVGSLSARVGVNAPNLFLLRFAFLLNVGALNPPACQRLLRLRWVVGNTDNSVSVENRGLGDSRMTLACIQQCLHLFEDISVEAGLATLELLR